MVTIFKKGNAEDMNNYRPISLLQISYKIFAALLLKRLKDGGAEERIWKTQFGFRSSYGTNDALFYIRRMIDRALASKDEQLIILALDWAKAFDSISPDALCIALKRFAISAKLTSIIRDIYSKRIFRVRWNNGVSSFHPQLFGISQGYPLSPFLFSILMTVLIYDCRTSFMDMLDTMLELLYADDTLWIGNNTELVQKYMQCIATEGRKYGLILNNSKLEMMQININATIMSFFNKYSILDPGFWNL